MLFCYNALPDLLEFENKLTSTYELVTALQQSKSVLLSSNLLESVIIKRINLMKQEIKNLNPIQRFQAYIRSLQRYIALHNKLKSNSTDSTEKLITEYIMARFESLVYVSGAYQNREAIKHVVYGMQSNKQYDGDIRYEYSILQNIGSLLLHTQHNSKEGVPLGRTLWRTAKYAQRIADALWKDLETTVPYKTSTNPVNEIAKDLAKFSWPYCPQLTPIQRFNIASFLLTNIRVLSGTKKSKLDTQLQPPFALDQQPQSTFNWDFVATASIVDNYLKQNPQDKYLLELSGRLNPSQLKQYFEQQQGYLELLAKDILEKLKD